MKTFTYEVATNTEKGNKVRMFNTHLESKIYFELEAEKEYKSIQHIKITNHKDRKILRELNK